ncbi:hypothetical protein QYF36_000863 [Acer negundo]|nr:hypothetical protein QYF36_000863 [Acer negundo]
MNKCDMYGNEEPWQIWESYGGNHLEDGKTLYLFTRMKKVSVRGSRVSKKMGSGTWAGESSGEKIVVGGVMSFKKCFWYENQHFPLDMHEFALDSNLFIGLNKNDIILCRLKKNLSEEQRGVDNKQKRNLKQPNSCDSKPLTCPFQYAGLSPCIKCDMQSTQIKDQKWHHQPYTLSKAPDSIQENQSKITMLMSEIEIETIVVLTDSSTIRDEDISQSTTMTTQLALTGLM